MARWENGDMSAGREAIHKAQEIAAANPKTTAREIAYVDALAEIYRDDGENGLAHAQAFEKKMGAVQAAYPNDSEAAIFHAKVAVKIIEKNGKVHGQQSRAIQVAVELLWEKVGWKVPDRAMSAILDSPLTGKTYKLPPRTVSFIESLAHEYGTQGRVLAAVAYMLSKPDPREGHAPAPGPTS